MSDGVGSAILIVEDEPDIAALLAEILEAEGYRARTARNGRIGLDALRAQRFDAVVLDMMMPEVDGFGVLAAWRAMPEPKPPVIAASAFEAYLPAALASGAAAVLRKPFELDALLATVRDTLAGVRTPAPPAATVEDEARRLQAVLELQLEAPAPTRAMADFVERVARIFEVPVCLVSIVNAERQFWHASCGLTGELAEQGGTPRRDSFCAHAVVANAALVVQDAAVNPLFADNRLVREHGLRFYAGVPLANRFGDVLGTVCLLDLRPRPFSAFDLELLSVLARRVVAELEWRDRRAQPATPDAAFRYLAWLDEELDVLGREALEQAVQVQSLRAAEKRAPLSLAVAELRERPLQDAVPRMKASLPGALLGRLGQRRVGILAFGIEADEARERIAAAAGDDAVVRAVAVPPIVGAAERFLHQAELAAIAAT